MEDSGVHEEMSGVERLESEADRGIDCVSLEDTEAVTAVAF